MPYKIKSFLILFRMGDAILVVAVFLSLAIVYLVKDPDIRSYIMNVSASFLFASIIRGVELYRGIFRQISFIRFFGGRIANNAFSIVYPEFGINPKIRVLARDHDIASQALFVKNNQKLSSDDAFKVDLESCAASNDLRAMIELSSLFAKQISQPTRITADKEWESILEKSFVSVGFSSNYVTHKWLGLARAQVKCEVDTGSRRYGEFVRLCVQNGDDVEFRSSESDGEIGLVVKFRPDPTDRPDIIWFFCAGLGGDGTIGSTIFLTRKWTKLLKMFGEDDFILIIRTAPGVAMHPVPIYAISKKAAVPVERLT